MRVDQVIEWLNATYPSRDWDQDCQRLVWNVVWHVLGVPESVMNPPYPTATAARLASRIESTDASKAPEGAIHYWLYPADGHVAVGLGGSRVLMTGTKQALGDGGQMLGTNYGVTTVEAYSASKGNKYLGWSLTNGRYPSIVGKLGTPGVTPMEADMKLIKVVQPSGTTWALLGLGFFQETRDQAQANAWAEVWGDAKPVSDPAWEQAYNAALLGQGMLSRVTGA